MKRSLVAGVNALLRAHETKRPENERLLSDPWAELFVERGLRVRAIRGARFLIPSLGRMVDQLQTVHCIRHRAIDALLLKAVKDGYRQVVILGAGYDMRAARFSRELSGVRLIEVDHPATIARKRRLLARRTDLPMRVEHVAIDLLTDPLGGALFAAGLDRAEPACFVLEGLIHYLTRPRLDAILEVISKSSADVRVIASFIRSEMYQSAPSLFVRLVQILEEVPRLHFEVEELEALFARHGLEAFQSWPVVEQISAFGGLAGGRRIGVSQDVAQAERRRRPLT